MMQLEVGNDRSNGIPVVWVRGEVDIATYQRLDQELRTVDTGRPGVVALDLRELRFIDSTGLRLIVEMNMLLKTDGRKLVIVPPPQPIYRIFELTRLDTSLEFVSDLQDITGS